MITPRQSRDGLRAHNLFVARHLSAARREIFGRITNENRGERREKISASLKF